MKTLIFLSDTHTNSTVGLSKPNVKRGDGESVAAGTARRWLFWQYEEILQQIEKEKQGELYAVLNGDMIELDAKGRNATELISHNQTEAVGYAVEVLEPLYAMCKGVYMIRGTDAHTGKQAQGEEAIAANFENTIKNPDTGAASWYWLPLEFDGVRMDIAHHPKGAGSGRPMNYKAGIDRMAADALFSYADEGQLPPHLVVRSHLHGYRDSGSAFRTRAIITPAFCLLTAYTYRVGINASNPIGAIMVHCNNGQYEVKPLTRKVSKPQWQVI